jgi:hypothetical protein
MSTANGNRAAETAAIAHVAAAERLARGVIVAFDSCEEVGVPLSEIQKIAVIEAMLLEFDGFSEHLCSLERVGRLLRDLQPM